MIRVEHLTKCYGDFVAVDDLSFEIDEGKIYGFLGPNGAGKSTTMNIMTGCLSATDGKVLIDGLDIFEDSAKAKKLIGYLPEQPPLYVGETPLEYLRFVGRAKGVKAEELDEQVLTAIEKTGLNEVKNRIISTLSKGYRQRVGIAQAILGSPKVIILDEPTVGLDPIQIIEIRQLIQELGREHTVILSSHILSEVQAICEEVLIISKGKLIAFDCTENLENHLKASGEVRFDAECEPEVVEQVLNHIPNVSNWEIEGSEDGVCSVTVHLDSPDFRNFSRKLFFSLAERGHAILELSAKKVSLEDVFLELTGEELIGEEPTGGLTEESEVDEQC